MQRERIRPPAREVYPQTHLWFSTNWARLMKLEELTGPKGNKINIDQEDQAVLAGIRTHMTENRTIRQSQITEIGRLYKKYVHR